MRKVAVEEIETGIKICWEKYPQLQIRFDNKVNKKETPFKAEKKKDKSLFPAQYMKIL